MTVERYLPTAIIREKRRPKVRRSARGKGERHNCDTVQASAVTSKALNELSGLITSPSRGFSRACTVAGHLSGGVAIRAGSAARAAASRARSAAVTSPRWRGVNSKPAGAGASQSDVAFPNGP